MARNDYWTNKSVRTLAGTSDPIALISQKTREIIFRFLEGGGLGPPFNPFEIADFLKIELRPTEDVRDARTFYHEGKPVIEFNPNRPISRINYSVSHDIVHTFFPDCKDEVRNRSLHEDMTGDDWQLEMLCNIGAAELLMPIGSFPDLAEEKLSIEKLLELRKAFNVSMEALLLRFVKVTNRSCWVFAASRPNPDKSLYKIDYAIGSNVQLPKIPSGFVLPRNSPVSDCTAIGFTAKGHETWISNIGEISVECVGIPAYPGNPFPRVVGFARPSREQSQSTPKPVLVNGDATKPRGQGKKFIAFVVNDATPRWGAGFALAVKRKWPKAQEMFTRWTIENPKGFVLGTSVITELDNEICFAQMVCQRGYGESKKPRLRYGALDNCLQDLATAATSAGASVHMPMIGSGQAGGNWSIILEMIERRLSRKGVNVVIYQLPNTSAPKNRQMSLLFSD